VGRRESPAVLIASALGLFVLAAVFAFLLPALDVSSTEPAPINLTASALQGRETYIAEGCWYCHTQQVRPIVTDAGLGPVTQPAGLASIATDTLGVQRIGPDLAHAGSREPTQRHEWLEDFLRDPQGTREGSLHAAYDYLSEEDLHDLAHFVWESR
jgi:cytochrome c oxidase cbb3-type subunit 2